MEGILLDLFVRAGVDERHGERLAWRADSGCAMARGFITGSPWPWDVLGIFVVGLPR